MNYSYLAAARYIWGHDHLQNEMYISNKNMYFPSGKNYNFLAGGCHLENKIIFQVKRCVIMSTGEMYISTKEMFISITEMYYYWAILFVPGALRKKVNFVL